MLLQQLLPFRQQGDTLGIEGRYPHAATPSRPMRWQYTSAASTAGSESAVLRGYAIVFGARSVNLGGFVEVIKSSAVDRMLAERTDLRALWNHNSEITIGRVKAGTLTLSKDATGLRVRIATPT